MARRYFPAVFLLFLLITSLLALSQAPASDSAAIESRVESLLKKLTLEEKVDLIGGVDDFYIRHCLPRKIAVHF